MLSLLPKKKVIDSALQARFAIAEAVDAAYLSDVQQTGVTTTFVSINPEPVHVDIRQTKKKGVENVYPLGCARSSAKSAIQTPQPRSKARLRTWC